MKYITLILLLVPLQSFAHGPKCQAFANEMDGLRAQIFQLHQIWNVEHHRVLSFKQEVPVSTANPDNPDGYPLWDEAYQVAQRNFDQTNESLQMHVKNFNLQTEVFRITCGSGREQK